MQETPHPQISQRKKAAAIVQLLVENGDSLALDRLPEPMQSALTDELGSLRRIGRDVLDDIIAEFTQEVENIGLTAPGTRDGAIMALADHLSPPLAAKLRAQTAAVRGGDHWPRVIALPEDVLVRILTAEAIEVGAIALSKMPVTKAATALAQMPGERARRITYAMARTTDIAPDTVHRIGVALAQDYASPAPRAFDKPPVQRLGAILNAAATDTREDMLAGLDAQDQPFAKDVRKAIFTFKDITQRVKATDIPNCIRSVDGAVLGTALAAALQGDDDHVAAAEFILASLSQRMASQLRDDAAERGKIRKPEAETAMAEITMAIRDMMEKGMITLIDPDMAEDDDSDAT